MKKPVHNTNRGSAELKHARTQYTRGDGSMTACCEHWRLGERVCKDRATQPGLSRPCVRARTCQMGNDIAVRAPSLFPFVPESLPLPSAYINSA